MKLLFDHNLSPKLVLLLAEQYPGSSHVASVAMDKASDSDVWAYARASGFTIVTKDSDFNVVEEFLASVEIGIVELN